MRDLIRSEYTKAPSLPSGVWDCALNAEVRLAWLVAAWPFTPLQILKKLAELRWFQAKPADRILMINAVKHAHDGEAVARKD